MLQYFPAFGLGFLLSLIPIVTSPLLIPDSRMFDGSLYWLWGIELSVATLVLSIYRSERAWKWALAVGAGLPAAVLARGCVEMILYGGNRSPILSLFLFVLLTSIFATIAATLGSVSGYLIRKTYDNW